MSSSEIALPTLDRILNSEHKLVGIVTRPDKPEGRGKIIKKCIVKEYANKNDIICFDPIDLNENDFIEGLKKLNPELAVVFAFRILPKEVFTISKFGTINIHSSLLPEYRGAAPINWAIINGEKETGITIIFINEKIDSGDIILQKKISIKDDETAGELKQRISVYSVDVLMDAINKIQNGDIHPIPQKDNNFKKAPKIKPHHLIIDWSKSAIDVHNLIRGLSPLPGAYTTYNNKRIKILKSKIYDPEKTEGIPGSVYISDLEKGLVLNAGKGMIYILELMKEGKKRMSIREFLIGNKIIKGEIFR
jgi:methionyl-tRNA formyltransferase